MLILQYGGHQFPHFYHRDPERLMISLKTLDSVFGLLLTLLMTDELLDPSLQHFARECDNTIQCMKTLLFVPLIYTKMLFR